MNDAYHRRALALQGRRAGVVSRALAMFVDIGVVVAVLIVGYLVFSGVLFLLHPRGFSFPRLGSFFTFSSAAFVAVIYLTIGWVTAGRTVGDQVVGLRVVDERGQLLRIPRALVRAILCVFFPVGLFWSAISQRSASVQDLVVRTTVVYDWGFRVQASGSTEPLGRRARATRA
jgi:uncharacterized RDD family membrane protein YckC